ncbi:MAG: cytochrome d ubiquinol oxidase subunit II [Coriobacteriia bacterium]|nr:cytochrome d ubiquinol oxidase subunit II [Coriobacteriia bacterium]
MTVLGVLWFILIFVLIIGYFVLDGFDLGAGVLYPFVAKSDADKMRVLHAIGPVWDGNEVWLLTAGGALFAAFAPAYATVFSGFYLAIMLVLFGLILRAVSIEFRAHGNDMAKLWDVLFFIGSLLPALLLGVAMGNILQGLQLNDAGDYTGGFFALLNPFALLCGVLGLVHMLTQGASWLALKAPEGSDLRKNAVAMRKVLCLADIALFVVAAIAFNFVVVPYLPYPVCNVAVAGACAVLFAVVMVAQFVMCKDAEPARDLWGVLLASLGCVFMVCVFAFTVFPNLVPAITSTASITVATAASSEATLGAMTIIACIGVPIVLVYHVLVYRAFRGRVK